MMLAVSRAGFVEAIRVPLSAAGSADDRLSGLPSWRVSAPSTSGSWALVTRLLVPGALVYSWVGIAWLMQARARLINVMSSWDR